MKLSRGLCLASALLVAAWPLISAGEAVVDPTGTWNWVAPADPDGQIPKITFVLLLKGETLTGTRVTSTGAVATLTNCVIEGDHLHFQTPRHPIDLAQGKISFASYRGRLSGDAIRGTVTIFVDGKILSSRKWEIRRFKPEPTPNQLPDAQPETNSGSS